MNHNSDQKGVGMANKEVGVVPKYNPKPASVFPNDDEQ